MSQSPKNKRLIDFAWLQAALFFLAIIVLWWVRRRSQEPLESDEPVIWRRDIEMGPNQSQAEPAGESPARTAGLELAVEDVPDTHIGEGGQELVEQVEMQAGEGARVEGPIPTPEGETLETPGGDDLEIIEGIGPKINSILQEAGIRTFAQLAAAEVTALEDILRKAGLRRINNPATWPEQAKLAAEGDWSKLDSFQGQLKAGRR